MRQSQYEYYVVGTQPNFQIAYHIAQTVEEVVHIRCRGPATAISGSAMAFSRRS